MLQKDVILIIVKVERTREGICTLHIVHIVEINLLKKKLVMRETFPSVKNVVFRYGICSQQVLLQPLLMNSTKLHYENKIMFRPQNMCVSPEL